ncbi:MAG: hypothetical protein JWL87_607 [Candidatus Adlerbacteria bacterium]|nr:hypothetical protein [Candidatus Adlerbacteria bacterium]
MGHVPIRILRRPAIVMTRKIIFIIGGALLFLALLGILWFWLLNREPAVTTQNPSGFGTSSDRGPSGSLGSGDPSNTPSTIPGTDTGGLDGIDITGSGIDTGSQGSSGSNSDSQTGSANSSQGGNQSAAWVGGGINTTVTERAFTAAEINQINSTAGISGTPLISTTPQAAGLGTSGLVLGLAAAGCLAQYLAYEISGNLQATTDGPKSLAGAGPYVVVFDFNSSAKLNNTKFKSVEECLVKTIAQAAIDQITRSIVTWINSGFNGKPSFVTNFNQYFANVADQAAGEFLKSSALSFLCSPFAPQIKIAVAQSYANRNNANGAACTLSKVTNNINGWGRMLQMTTSPANNQFGAYSSINGQLSNYVNNAQANANRNVSPGGFISLQKCDASKGESVAKGNCKVTTPGEVIQQSLNTSLASPIQGLNLSQNINDIIRALTNQVMIKTLYGGLGNSLGVTNPLTPAIDQAASAQAQGLLSELQGYLGYAGQYANVEQGSIADIQGAQSGLNMAFNCWSTAASSTALNSSQQASAADKAASLDSAQTALEVRITAYNDEITRSNASLGLIQNMQSQVMFATTPEEVSAAASAISSAAAQGSFLTQADITTAQQNRTTLQTELAARNQQTNASLAECRALGA